MHMLFKNKVQFRTFYVSSIERCKQFKIGFFLLFCFSSHVESFEVKVLLQKFREIDFDTAFIQIQSPHGFVISPHAALAVGHSYHDKHITISSKNKILSIHGQEVTGPCYIFPLLSAKHKEQLSHIVQNWLNDHSNCLQEKTNILHDYFDSFFNKKGIVASDSSASLSNYIHDSIMSFLFDFIADKDPVVSLQTLQSYVDYYLEQDINELFLDQLATLVISKKERKLLLEDKSFRYDFFSKQISIMISRLLKDFIVILPRHFITQMLHDEVGSLNWQGNNYLGSFTFIQESDAIYFINNLDIDDYLLSVIRHEGWPGWPLEMNKVLAVTCRTYLVWQILQAQKLKRPYHIENGIRHQSYKGHHKFVRLKQAVEETRDICIAFNNKPILAMFDSCCGGIIPALVDHSDYQKHPYLLRQHKCIYCKDFKIANWKATFSHDEMVEVLKKSFPDLTTIDSMRVIKKDPAGLVKNVSVSTASAKPFVLNVTRKKMYSIFPEIKSYCFDIETLPKKLPIKQKSRHQKNKKALAQENLKIEKQFVISGKGQGHHMGLCQWGAMKLVRDNHWSYQNVLQFYYPGTTLIKLTYQR